MVFELSVLNAITASLDSDFLKPIPRRRTSTSFTTLRIEEVDSNSTWTDRNLVEFNIASIRWCLSFCGGYCRIQISSDPNGVIEELVVEEYRCWET